MTKLNTAKARNTPRAKIQRKAHRGAAAQRGPEAAPGRGAPKLGGSGARIGKLASMIAILRRPKGATIEQMMTATGWQAHSVRGTISGALKKKRGFTVTSDAATGSARVYRIVE